MSDVLPKGWIGLPLEKCVAILDSKRIPINNAERERLIKDVKNEELVPYYGATGQVGFINNHLFDEELVLLGEDGVSFYDPYKFKAYEIKGKSWVNNHAHVLKAMEGISINSYICHYLNQFNYQGYITGSTRLKLNQGRMKKIPVRLAPYEEQNRIAEKLEQLLSAVDATKNRLDKVPTILKRFRQSVLAAAVSGELTKDWRGENGFPDEPQKDQDADSSPPTWKQVPLGDLSESISYGSSKKSQKEGDVPVIRMGNIQQGEIDWENLVYTSDKEEIEKYALAQGDVLFNRTNSPELVGKTAIYRGERKAINAGYLIKVCTTNELDPEYLNICLNSPFGRDYCWQVKTDGVSQSNINAKKLAAFPIRLPSQEEQVEISLRVKTLLNVAIQFEQKLDDSRKIVEKLGQSILVKAFKGELVPQDPNDEPAQLLLKKITKAKREKKVSKPARRRKKNMPSKAKTGSLHSIVDILKSSETPMSAQQLLAIYAPTSPDSEEVEKFFVALRDYLTKKEILQERRGEEDWFSLATGASVS